ncbi:alpha/beta hydrolase [Nannocystaceae bacterium ST9]
MSGAARMQGPAGRLEAIYRVRPGARMAALLCHSHPQRGGSMYDALLHRIACALHAAGVSTLRFNFRGTGGSEGSFDGGVGEVEDVRAAIDHAARDHAELIVLGFSFGAWVGLRAGSEDPRVARLVGLSAPVDAFDFSFLAAVSKPLLFVHADRDEWGGLATVQALAADLDHARVEVVSESDHFFRGRLDAAAAACVAFTTASLVERGDPR